MGTLNEGGFAVFADDGLGEVVLGNGRVVVAGVGWVNAEIGKRGFAGVDGAVGGVSGNVDDGVFFEGNKLGGAGGFVLELHEALAGEADVDFGGGSVGVVVAFGKIVFVSDASGIEGTEAVVELGVAVGGFDRSDGVHEGVAVFQGGFASGFVDEEIAEVGEVAVDGLAIGKGVVGDLDEKIVRIYLGEIGHGISDFGINGKIGF